MKREKIIGARVWAVRGAKHGTLFVNRKGLLTVADSKKALLKIGISPLAIARIEIIEPRKKPDRQRKK